MFIKSFLQNIKHLTISTSIGIALIYGYCSYLSYNNKKQYLQAIKSDTLKDASRLSNQSFGISWGFQADDTVMNNIDSGDLFFIKYECIECLNPLQMIQCYYKTIPMLDEEYHTMGVAYRDQTGLMAYFNQFGENKLMKYSQFVSLPYIKQLMVQKTSKNIHQKLLYLLQQDKAFQQISQDIALPNDPQKILKQKQQQQINIKDKISLMLFGQKQNTLEFINRILKKINFMEENQDDVVDLRQLLRNQKQVNIRTETNKTLRSL